MSAPQSPPSPAALLEVTDLTTHLVLPRRTVQAVDGVSFSIAAGETVGLVGESGSGKTMTGSSILQLLPEGGRMVRGSIKLDGRELTTLSQREMAAVRGREIGTVFQDPMTSLNPTMTIGDQIAEPLAIHDSVPKAARRARVLELLDLVGIPQPQERIESYPHQLSGGLRQRICIAAALACKPKLLIADEPTTALDVSIQDQILSLLSNLKRELGMAVLLVTHDMGVIAGHADRVLVMYAGQIVEATGRREMFEAPRHPYSEALLESLPAPDQDRRTPLATISGTPPDLSHPASHCRFSPRCRFATDTCTAEMPLLSADESGHAFACFHPRPPREPVVSARDRAAGPSAGGHPEPLLVLDNVVKEFPIGRGFRSKVAVQAVSGVSLTIHKGETFGIVGESGCGKTTIGRLMVALDKPDSGTVTLAGSDLGALKRNELRHRRRDLQMVFQDPYQSLDPRMRVQSILAEPMVIQKMYDRSGRQARVAELLGEVGLPASAVNQLPREFSGGQRQRIGFARALGLGPALIVADEPVSALDVSIRAQLLNLMVRLQADHDLSFVMISHDLSVVRYIADRVGVMYLGKLVETGPTAQVYDRPAHPYTAGLLEAIPVADPRAREGHTRAAITGELPSALNPPSGCRFRTRCPRAEAVCAEVEPVLTPVLPAPPASMGGPLKAEVAGTSHATACHFPLVPVVSASTS